MIDLRPARIRRSGSRIRHQRGSTLLVGLIMLVLLTLVAVSAINSTTASVHMVGNAQFREEAIAAGQRAIENVISSGDFRNNPPGAQTIKVNSVAVYTVTFEPPPQCVSYKPVDPTDPAIPMECASSIGDICFWTQWDIRAVVTAVDTGARVALHQGVRTIAGLNAGVTSCGI
jgi:hypothetical protein